MGPIVMTTGGKVEGVVRPNGYAFLGVPYAAPPFGPRRFGAPVPPEPWDGVRAVDRFAPTAPQPEQGFTIIPEPIIDGGDAPDCLCVNVFTPDLGSAGLPVLVWIHGGGYTNGTASSPWYDGDRFARDGVVVVSVGYRLGAEGFLAIDGAPDNRGVLDWLGALGWVRDNIADFGGDPDRVTIGGQSAGGGACTVLAAIPRGRGLFHQVLPMSGTTGRIATAERAAKTTARVAEKLGIEATAAAFAAVSPGRLVDAQIAATRRGRAFATGLPFAPHVDGDLVPEPPFDVLRRRTGGALPFLLGATAHEFNMATRTTDIADDQLARSLDEMGLDAVGRALHRAAHPGATNGLLLGQAMTDSIFRVPAVRLAEARVEAGAPTYHYEFAWPSPAMDGIGACHCLDLPFAFDLLDAEGVTAVAGTEPPQSLADVMHRAWVAFVATGDPGWSAYEPVLRSTMVFDDPPRVVQDHHGPERHRWS